MEHKKGISKLLLTAMMTATLSASAYSLYLPSAEALGIGDIGGIISASAQYSQARAIVKKQCDVIDTTPEGQAEIYQGAIEQDGITYDSTLYAKLDRIMTNLITAVGKTDSSVYDLPYKYFVNPADYINASCRMAHVMSVNQGSFTQIPNEDELAVIIGHEMGHGQSHHIAKSIVNTYDKAFLAEVGSAALGGAELTQAIVNTAVGSSVIHHSKGDEKEADALSWTYITNSNYNPGACAAVWQRILELNGDNTQTGVDLWFNPSDHPNHMARRDKYVKNLEKYSNNHVKAKDGKVTVNGKDFVTPAAISSMSTPERSYFVMGNLAAAYHNGHNKDAATVDGRTVKLGVQPIITCTAEDEDPQVLADRLNSIK